MVVGFLVNFYLVFPEDLIGIYLRNPRVYTLFARVLKAARNCSQEGFFDNHNTGR
jgi:hypothetical protein